MSLGCDPGLWTRRLLLRGAGATAALLPASSLNACDRLTRARNTAGQSARALAIPPLEQGSIIQGERHFELALRKGEKSFGGNQPSPTIGINAPYLGPTLEMRRGEVVRFNVVNLLDEDATLHWHGFELPASADGGPHQIIPPGRRWTPAFEVRQRASLYWCHSHMHKRTGPQVYAGLAAPIYVRDDEEDRLELPNEYGVDDLPLVVQDRVVGDDGALVYPTGMPTRMMGVRGERVFVNGAPSPTYEAPTNPLRLRLLNASNARFYNFFLDGGRAMEVIASDGGLLDRPRRLRSLLLAPGERAQILVDLSDGAPVGLRAVSPSNGMGMMGGMMRDSRTGEGRRKFTILNILPTSGLVRAAPVPASLAELPLIDPTSAVRLRRFTLNMAMGMGREGRFTINGVAMDMNVVNERVPVNQWEIWEIGNTSMMAHPFHIHNVQFRILDRDGRPPPLAETGFKDTVVVNPGERVRLLLRFEQHTDPELPYMYHCHILEHEDGGMMGQFVVTG